MIIIHCLCLVKNVVLQVLICSPTKADFYVKWFMIIEKNDLTNKFGNIFQYEIAVVEILRLCCLVSRYQDFGGKYYLHLWGQSSNKIFWLNCISTQRITIWTFITAKSSKLKYIYFNMFERLHVTPSLSV
jgi:hypothetical protein